MYVRNNGDRRPLTEQPKGRTQRPVHISSSRSRDIIPPPDYSGTVLYDTGSVNETDTSHETAGEDGIIFNPRNETQFSSGKSDIPTSNGDNAALFASGHIPFEEQIHDGILNSDSSQEDNKPEPRRPLTMRSDYEEKPDNRPVPHRPLALRSDNEESDNRPVPRRPLAKDIMTDSDSRNDPQSESSHPVITHRNGHSYHPGSSESRKESNMTETDSSERKPDDKFPLLPGFVPPASDDLLLCGLIVLLLLSGSDDELIIILAFLLLSH